jgi:hypothetical protein
METGLVKSSFNLPKFVEDAYSTIEKMNQFADILLESKLVPDHFFEKGSDRKPDYNKGKRASVVIVLLQSQQLGIPPLTGLQQIIPVNGLLSLKGDLCKTMIFSSGKLKQDSWIESESGDIESGTLKMTITAARSDNGMALTRSFSIDDAKRAGLWVTDDDLKGNDGWKKKKSAWYRHPKRMLLYRCLGFISRDLFTDIIFNMYTTEEAMDIPQDETLIIENSNGTQVTIPDKEFSQERSQQLTGKAADKIAKEEAKIVPPEEAVVVTEEAPINQSEMDFENQVGTGTGKIEESKTVENTTGPQPHKYTEDVLMAMDIGDVRKIISSDVAMFEAQDKLPGTNTNKKLRLIILNNQKGELNAYCKANGVELEAFATEVEEPQKDVPEEKVPEQRVSDKLPQPTPTPEKKEVAPEDHKIPEKPTQDFPLGENKFGITVVEIPEGDEARSFDDGKTLYEELESIAGLDNKRYAHLIGTTFTFLAKYTDREQLCFKASKAQINSLLNSMK